MKRKSVVGLDLDDVVAQFVPEFLRRYNKKFGTFFCMDSITDYENISKHLNISRKEFRSFLKEQDEKGMFRKLKLMYESGKYLKKLSKDYTFIAITARTNAGDTLYWIRSHDLPIKKAVLAHDKKPVYDNENVDVVIDDKIKNIEESLSPNRLSILYTRPWNEDYNVNSKQPTLLRCDNWRDIHYVLNNRIKVKHKYGKNNRPTFFEYTDKFTRR